MSRQFKRVAIVHDWLIGGGAELVVEQLHLLYPDAPIYTSYATNEWRKRLDGKVITGWPQHLGRIRKFIPYLRIWWFTHLDLSSYDMVISSSGAEAKGIKTPESTLHINYCHAPTHYYWSRYDEYLQHPGFGAFDWLARIGLKLLVNPLRKWDYKAAQRPDIMIANSSHIQAEIKHYYHRETPVVHPPVYLDRFIGLKAKKQDYFLISGRQTPYKRFDLAVQACTQLKLPLHVVGSGPDNLRLRSMAGSSITFLGYISDHELEREFAAAKALIFPGTDDFGITPVEAMAAGTPVIAYYAGGALDYVRPHISGEFFSEASSDNLASALQSFDSSQYVVEQIRAIAAEYSIPTFRSKFLKILESVN